MSARYKYGSWIQRFVIAIDQLFNVILCNGSPDETISAQAYLWHMDGIRSWPMRFIDFIFLPFEDDHCYKAVLSEINGKYDTIRPEDVVR